MAYMLDDATHVLMNDLPGAARFTLERAGYSLFTP